MSSLNLSDPLSLHLSPFTVLAAGFPGKQPTRTEGATLWRSLGPCDETTHGEPPGGH